MTEIYTWPDEYSDQKVWIPASQTDRLMIRELRFDGNGNFIGKTELDKDNMNYLIRLKRF